MNLLGILEGLMLILSLSFLTSFHTAVLKTLLTSDNALADLLRLES
jgi:hypothetical protein